MMNQMRVFRTLLLTLAVAFLVTPAGCAENTSPTAVVGGIPTASSDFGGDSALQIIRNVGNYLGVGSTLQLATNYSTEQSRRGIATVRWGSSETGVVSIGNSTGILRALQPGSTVITAIHSAAGVDTLTLMVLDTTGIAIIPGTVSLDVSDSVDFTALTAAPIDWASSDSSIIVVDGRGRATAKSFGTATIIATTPIGTRGTAGVVVVQGGGAAPPTDTTSGGTKPPPSDTTSVPPPVPPGDTTSAPPPPVTPPAPSTVELPRVFLHDMVEEARSAQATRTITVSTSTQLQAALDTSKYGDEILVNPGTYVGSFVLRNKSGDGWITIRGKTAPSLPAAGVRMRPSQSGAVPKLLSNGANTPSLRTDATASGYRLVHLEISAAPSVTALNTLVSLGSGSSDQSNLDKVPRRIVLDRVYLHGKSDMQLRRCLSMHSASTAIVDSWISECHDKGFDSQAIASWNGPGPYMIVNNHLEGAGENLMFGGADPSIPNLLPEDIEIRRNYFFKPTGWMGVWTVKNAFELKFGKRVLVEDNIFENVWADAQVGFAVTLKSVNQSNKAPWSETSDVTFRHNIIRNAAHGISLAGRPEVYPAVPMSRVYVGHNSFEQIGTGLFAGGRLWYVGAVSNLTFEYNSGAGSSTGLLLDAGVSPNLRVQNNVFGTAEPRYDSWDFSIVGSTARGEAALNYNSSNWVVSGNVLTGKPSSAFPPGNSWPAAGPSGLGVVSFPNNLRFLPSSQFINKGVDGVMPGVDFDVLAARTAGVVVPP